MELMVVPAASLRNLLLFRVATAILLLVLGQNTYIAQRSMQRGRKAIHYLSFTMNLLLFSLSFFLPLRDPLDYSCQVYSGLFFACYTVSVTFSGFILMIKAYYASSMSRLLLLTLIFLHLLSIATNIYATIMVYIAYNPVTTLCITDIHIPSFILSIATEFAFNLLVTVVFLVYIFQANRQFRSSLYRILFIDGMVAWISIAFFRGLLIFTFNRGFNDMAAILIAISVLVTSCIITWQLRHSRMKERL